MRALGLHRLPDDNPAHRGAQAPVQCRPSAPGRGMDQPQTLDRMGGIQPGTGRRQLCPAFGRKPQQRIIGYKRHHPGARPQKIAVFVPDCEKIGRGAQRPQLICVCHCRPPVLQPEGIVPELDTE